MTYLKGTVSPKGVQTRLKILEAARSVFTSMPFRAAGIRLVAKKAGIRHPLVLHYFGSKDALFDEVVEELEREILEGYPDFFDQLERLSLSDRRLFFIEGVIRQGFQKPDAYKLLLLNAGDAKYNITGLPGMSRFISVMEKLLDIARRYLLGDTPEKEASVYMLVFTLAVSHFVGGRVFHQHVLGMSSFEDYKDWVITTMNLIFDPLLKTLQHDRIPAPPAWDTSIQDRRKALKPLKKTGHDTMKGTRGIETRKRIIEAATIVFSSYTYDMATIRMIGQAGNFDYSRIHHFFPTKADLFEAVAIDLFGSYIQEIDGWEKDLTHLTVDDMFLYYLQKGLNCCFDHQETLGFLVRNIANYERFENLSGFVHMARIHSKMLDMIKNIVPKDRRFEDVDRWLYVIVVAGYSFAGAPDYPAYFMNLKPVSGHYRKRIFESLFFVFRPSLMSFTGKETLNNK
jgi:AcrR family transcriptional regulator